MKEVVKYESNDGNIFNYKEECINYEKTVSKAEEIMSILFARPDNCDFSNGSGYIQHAKKDADEAIKNLFNLAILSVNIPTETIDAVKTDVFRYRDTIIGRYLSDGNSPIWRYWQRFLCMTDDYKEYGQPYFTLNPDRAKNFQINQK